MSPPFFSLGHKKVGHTYTNFRNFVPPPLLGHFLYIHSKKSQNVPLFSGPPDGGKRVSLKGFGRNLITFRQHHNCFGQNLKDFDQNLKVLVKISKTVDKSQVLVKISEVLVKISKFLVSSLKVWVNISNVLIKISKILVKFSVVIFKI